MWYVIDVVRDRYAINHLWDPSGGLRDALGCFGSILEASGTFCGHSGRLRDVIFVIFRRLRNSLIVLCLFMESFLQFFVCFRGLSWLQGQFFVFFSVVFLWFSW